MYKQTVGGIDRPVISIVFTIIASLMFTSVLAAVYNTSYASFKYYAIIIFLYLAACAFIYISTITRFEYAVLDNELIIRKFIRKRPMRIYSIKLVRSNCFYQVRYRRPLSFLFRHTHYMYLPFFNMFYKTALISFVDDKGHRVNLVFRPDDKLDAEIRRLKANIA